jgi:outer membrane protein assembly factor BamA
MATFMLFVLVGGVCRVAGAGEAVPDDAELEAAGARIGVITINSQQIFDLADPAENRLLFRAANRLHLRTRDSVIRNQLLFKSGDLYSARLLQETERNLREFHFLREPLVRAVSWHDGLVDINVDTHDVWTLQIGPSFGRSGGTNHSSLSFEDKNLLGFGKSLTFEIDHSVDRNSNTIEWRDPAINGTRWQDDIYLSKADDGHERRIDVWRPFFALNTRRSHGLSAAEIERTDTRYALGQPYDSYILTRHSFEIYSGWSGGLRAGRTRRLTAGWNLTRDEFRSTSATLAAPPANRDLSYPYVRLDWIRDEFKTTRDLELIERTEDVQFGLSGAVVVGAVSENWGADRNAVPLRLLGSYGHEFSSRQQLYLSASYQGRIEAGESRDQRINFSAAWYLRTGSKWLTHARISGSRGSRLDLDHYVSLGGDNGLRGYPLRYQLGTGITQIKLEERLFTGKSLFRLFDIGAAAFFDAGRVHGSNPLGAPNLGWLKDVGIGLRFGNTRSAIGNVIHVDLATPLDRMTNMRGLQWLVSTEATF